MTSKIIRVGTRGSELALYQTNLIIQALRANGYEAEPVIIKTRGDADQRPFTQMNGDGFFTKELERALHANEIDLAMHSSKDLPSMTHELLPWKAFSHREDPSDILISKPDSPTITIGTSSPRREFQLKKKYEGIRLTSLRGNVPTRIQKVVTRELDAIVLAKAGVKRLGLLDDLSNKGLKWEELDSVTAPCQGIIGVQANANHMNVLNTIANEELDFIAKAEKSVLALLGGGCHLPLGVRIDRLSEGFSLKYFLGAEEGNQELALRGGSLGQLLRKLVSEIVAAPTAPEKRVWIASPLQHSLKPAKLLAQKGIEPVLFPLLEAVPCWSPSELLSFAQTAHAYKAVAFGSQFGVQLFMTELAGLMDLESWFKSVSVFAVGPVTERKLREFGVSDITRAKETNGEALAMALKQKGVWQSVVVPGARESIVKSKISGFDGKVLGLSLYRMRPSTSPLSQDMPEVMNQDQIVLSSPSAAREFVLRTRQNPNLKRLRVWAFGPTTSQELSRLKVDHKCNPVSGSWDSLIEVL